MVHSTLFSELGCHQSISKDLLLETLKEIRQKHDIEEGNVSAQAMRKDLQIVMAIINWFRNKLDDEEIKTMTILMPIDTKDENRLCLRPARDCTYYDLSFLKERPPKQSDNQIMFAHSDISEATARKLGVMTKERKRLKDNSMLMSFGQNEKMVTRLKRLLKGYPCDTGIMKELIQNADDAKATEIHFIKDYRTHSTEKLFDESFSQLQGPALLVFNNSAFNEDDLKGIQDLGIGRKAEDSTKTGQYGIGFNAVNNLTDAPSFLVKGPDINYEINKSNETLCFFDPMCKYIPDIDPNCPGMRIIDLHQFRGDFPDMLSCYAENEFFQKNEIGTLFRFPLRMTESELSQHVVTPDDVDELLENFEKDVLDMLLFVKHVTAITISNISSGQLVTEYYVNVSLTEDSKVQRKNLSRQLEKFAVASERNKSSIFDQQFTRYSYEMTATDSREESRSWYIVQQIGIESDVPVEADIRDAYEKGNIGLLPQGGIAMSVDQQNETGKANNRNGKAFCVLPLPIDTGLPVEVHGYFLLDHETRRNLWEDEGSYKTKWNQMVLRTVVAPAYVCALEVCLHHILKSRSVQSMKQDTAARCLKRFENYFPNVKGACGRYWKWLSQYVYQYIYDVEACLFPVLKGTVEASPVSQLEPEVKTEVSITWTAIRIEGFKFPAYFVPEFLSSDIVNILQMIGMRIIETSRILQESVDLSNRKTEIVSKKSVRDFLRSYTDTCKDKCHIGGINKPVAETFFKDIDNVKTIAEYCLKMDKEDEEDIVDGIPLLVTNDGLLRELTRSKPVFVTKFCSLLPSLGNQFVSTCLVSTFPSALLKQTVCKEFLMEDFLEMFPQSVEHTMFGVNGTIEWNSKNEHIPNKSWMHTLWSFIWNVKGKNENNDQDLIRSESKYYTKSMRDMKLKHEKDFKQYLSDLGQHSFIPSTDKKLHPVSELYTLMKADTFECGSRMHRAIEKLKLPELEKKCLPYEPELLKELYKYITSANKPEKVLECFCFHKNRINAAGLSREESVGILRYFADNLSMLKRNCSLGWLKESIKSMRLFETQKQSLVSIESDKDVLVLVSDIPEEGIALWASQNGKLLLKKNEEFDELYSFLGFERKVPLRFYTENVQQLA